MKFDKYQKLAHGTVAFNEDFYPWASLMIEAAELADLVCKPWLRGDGDGKFAVPHREQVVSEAGDVLWNLAVLLEEQGISLEEVAKYNIKKIKRRQKDGTIQGSGDR